MERHYARASVGIRGAVRTREIYFSANRDRWCSLTTLMAAGNRPEEQELLRLIGTLV